MLTAYQCEVMGAYTDSGMVCIECATELAGERVQDPEVSHALLRGESVDLGLHTFIRYELDEMQDNDEDYALCGIYCDNCNAELAAPWGAEEVHDTFHDSKYPDDHPDCEYCQKEKKKRDDEYNEAVEELNWNGPEDQYNIAPWVDQECEENENEYAPEYYEEDNDEQE